ncbi:putative photosynthetic complex assembly protein PuhE [Rhodosalinus sp. K401]|uniref:putative photosynthetic complex assembly protein PuhE n=1 Tax=Rhodosalinus sp. K401 TaxID=3239195 RepID=UPI00352401B8
MPDSGWIAALFALFTWWFSTGAILAVVRLADRRGPRANSAATLLSLPLLAAGIWGYHATLGGTGPAAVYGAFLAALAIWGWIELAFLTGQITGPMSRPCPPGVPEGERFIRAWGTIAYHEMLLAGMLIALALWGWGAENLFGLWTFAVLFCARISAKLNLFYGVPKINVEFIPEALAHLPSHFRTGRINRLFPLSVSLLTAASACWAERLIAADTPSQVVGFALLFAITVLALLEHWLMVIPWQDAKLWRWMLPERPKTTKTYGPEDAHGL